MLVHVGNLVRAFYLHSPKISTRKANLELQHSLCFIKSDSKCSKTSDCDTFNSKSLDVFLEEKSRMNKSACPDIHCVRASYLLSPKISIWKVKLVLLFNLRLFKNLIMMHSVTKASVLSTGILKRSDVFVKMKPWYEQKCLYMMLIMLAKLTFVVLKNPFWKQIFNCISICVLLKI